MATLTPEQQARMRVFLNSLRLNPAKATRRMESWSWNNERARCCLCVAYDAAQAMGANLPPHTGSMPPNEMAQFYGWPLYDPVIKHPVHNTTDVASSWNDSNHPRYSHKEIANMFEYTFLTD